MRLAHIAGQLDLHRSTLGNDQQFVLRCQDGAYGPLVSDLALDVVARDTTDGTEPAAADLADAIIAEVRQSCPDPLPMAA